MRCKQFTFHFLNEFFSLFFTHALPSLCVRWIPKMRIMVARVPASPSAPAKKSKSKKYKEENKKEPERERNKKYCCTYKNAGNNGFKNLYCFHNF